MRITTQMLNESARQAGLPINRSTLLDYIKSDGATNPLLEAMNRNKENVANTAKKSNYEKLDKEADQLTQSAQALLQDGENSLFEQAKASGDNQKVYDSIENLFENYNSILKALRTTSNTMNDFYRQMLLEAPAETKEGLAGVGITFAKDGTATVDMAKVKAADFTTLEDGQYKAYYNEGFYNTPEEVANHPYNAIDGNRVQGGDLRIVDVNGDGIIDDKDITPTGFSNVPRFAFSSNLSFGYKGFEISALLTGSAQGTFNMNGYLITPFAQGNGTPLSYMNGRWTPERHAAGKQITFPRMSVNMANSQNNQNNSFWFRSTDHIKLKNVEVAYTFRNARWMRKAHIGSIRVFVNANNLCTWGGKDLVDGIDPELVQDGSTSEGIIYPLTRVYNFGFNIQF